MIGVNVLFESYQPGSTEHKYSLQRNILCFIPVKLFDM